MPDSCSVPNCTNRRKKGETLAFYKIPSIAYPKRREMWLTAIKRDKWPISQINKAKVCGKHFISGKFKTNF